MRSLLSTVSFGCRAVPPITVIPLADRSASDIESGRGQVEEEAQA
jgi:hypothetical protein